MLSFRLNHCLHGLWTPGFHAVNVATHALVCVLFLWSCMGFGVNLATSVSASLLFTSHPIHTEAVSHVSSQNPKLRTFRVRHVCVYAALMWISSAQESLIFAGCQHRGALRATDGSVFPSLSHLLPENQLKKRNTIVALDFSNCPALWCFSALQGTGCDCAGPVSSSGAHFNPKNKELFSKNNVE